MQEQDNIQMTKPIMKKPTTFFGCYPPPKRGFLLEDEVETQGGVVTEAAAQEQSSGEPSTQTEPQWGEVQTEREAASSEQGDWSKEGNEGVDVDSFLKRPNEIVIRGESRIEREEKLLKQKNEQQGNEAGEEGAKENEAKTKEELEAAKAGEQQQQQQVDDTTKGAQVTKKEQTSTNQPDPLLEKFPEAVPFLKQMSKPAREFLTARLNDIVNKDNEIATRDEALKLAQAGKTQIPQNYYENPHAYLLLPEYQQSLVQGNLAVQVADHWDKQLRNILNGEPWRDLEPVTDKNGNVIGLKVGDKDLPADGNAQHTVSKYVNDSGKQLEYYQNYQQQIQSQFHQNVQQVFTNIKTAESELFPVEKWEKQGSKELEYVNMAKAGIKRLGITESNPVFGLFAKTAAALLAERAWREAQQKKTTTQQSIQKDQRKAGPTGDVLKAGGGSGGGNGVAGKEVTMDDFEKLRYSNNR